MLLKYLKAFVVISPLLLNLNCLSAAENEEEVERMRQTTLETIEQFIAVQPSTGTDEELASYFAELGAHIEGYVLNGLSRSSEETRFFYREAYDAFLASAEHSYRDYGASHKIADYAVKLDDIELLHSYFAPILESETDETNLYIARIDYASGLEKFGFVEEAEILLVEAIDRRPAADAYEAKYKYIQLLVKLERDSEALEIIETMTEEQRNGFNADLLYLEKSIIERLGYDKTQINLRVEEFYDRTVDAMGIDARRPPLAKIPSLLNFLGIERVNAYAHTVIVTIQEEHLRMIGG